MISVIFSTFNELSLNYFEKSLCLLSKYRDHLEIICVDGGSRDGTIELAKKYNVTVIKTSKNSRAKRLNIGIMQSRFQMILLHHPRSILNEQGLRFLLKNKDKYEWGGFTHLFDKTHPMLLFTSWYSNNVRAKIKEIVYLDHCIFIKKYLLQKVGNVPELDIFEDTQLSINLKEYYAPKLIPYPSKTSSIRFDKNGIFKQALLNQYLKIKYLMKADHIQMNKVYEKKLELNSKY